MPDKKTKKLNKWAGKRFKKTGNQPSKIEVERKKSKLRKPDKKLPYMKPELVKVKKVKPKLSRNTQQPQIEGKKQNFTRGDGQYNKDHPQASPSSNMEY